MIQRAAVRRIAGDRTALWLGCAAAALLLLAAAILSQVHSRQTQALRAQAAQTRAQLMAQSIGQRLAHATAAGIPLHKLAGVPQFLDRWHGTHPEVTQITIHDLDGKLLWRSQSPGLASTHEISMGGADVGSADRPQARVSLALHNGSLQKPGQRLALLLPAVLLISALAYLGALFACAQGPRLRNHGLRTIARWAVRGDYRRLLVLPQRRAFDLRVQQVARAMRSVHERMVRMRLLIGSLRRTEPQQPRRDYLDQVLQQSQGRDHFANDEPAMVRLVAVQFQSLWMALLLCLGALAPVAYALRVLAQSAQAAPAASAWQQALPAACLALLVLAAATGWQLALRLRIATLSVLILSHAALLLAPLALLLDSGLHPGWIAVWNGGFAGAAMAACTRAQTHPDDDPGFTHVQPGITGAALLAWWGGLLWLAPALGYYAQAALRPHWALLALLLPIVCGLFFATRWDVAHSPWRVRMAAAPMPRRAAQAWQARALGAAAGLAASALLLGLSTSRTDAPTPLLQQCTLGLGLALGLLRYGRDQDASAAPWRWYALALAACALQFVATPGEHAVWSMPDRIQWLLPLPLALLLGRLLAQGLAQAAQAPQGATSERLLLGSAFGAALGMGAAVLGLQDWAPSLALALLLARLTAARVKGSDVA